MYEATFCIEDESAYATATAGSSATIELWCNDHCDLLHVGDGAEEVVSRIRETVGVQVVRERDGEVVVVTADCLRHHEIDDIEGYLHDHGVLLLPPLRYRDGAKICRLVAVTSEALTACFHDLLDSGHEVRVESKRAVSFATGGGPLLAPSDAIPSLTARQREAVRVAHRLGYYELPRETDTETIATRMGVSRRTAEEHLRRAERKVMAFAMQYIT